MNNIYFTIFYIIFFAVTFHIRSTIRKKTLKSEKLKGKVIAKWTSKYIFYVYLIILFGSFIEYFVAKRNMNLFVSCAGIMLYSIGLFGRQWAFNSLGKYWSVDIEIRDNHELIKNGPYKYMRHPNNVFHLLEVLGITLIPNSYYFLTIFLITYFPIIILRSIIEEKAMLETLKEKYISYKQEVNRFFPKIAIARKDVE